MTNTFLPGTQTPCRVGAAEGPDWVSRGRVPCLDGLRAISILLVLFSHAGQTHGFPGLELMRTTFARPRELTAATGVDIFFFISGFLITLLLLRELSRTNTLSLKGFYARRSLRILPVYFAFVFVVFVLTRLGFAHLHRRDWVGVLTYTVNCISHPSWEIGHVWSLSIEEQFYLLWPPLLLLLRPKRACWALALYLLAAPALRVCARVFFPAYGALAYTFTLTRSDSIAAGCLLALLAMNPSFRLRTQMAGRPALGIGLLAFAVLAASIAAMSRSPVYLMTVGRSINAAAIAAILWLCANQPKSAAGRFLQTRPMVALGTLSYSIYIWQQLFLNASDTSWICRWPANLCLAVAAAAVSYLFIESPFLRLKDRLPQPRSTPAAAPERSQPSAAPSGSDEVGAKHPAPTVRSLRLSDEIALPDPVVGAPR